MIAALSVSLPAPCLECIVASALADCDTEAAVSAFRCRGLVLPE